MGLFDFFLGSEPKAVDTRMSRTKEGKRWWQQFEDVYGTYGPLNPLSTYSKAMAGLDQMMGFELKQVGTAANGVPVMRLVSTAVNDAPITVKAGNITRKVTPSWARELPLQYASAASGLMQPWLNAGMTLEAGRQGAMTKGSPGLFDYLGGAAAGKIGEGVGGALVNTIFGLKK
jgi:hypothetical protein